MRNQIIKYLIPLHLITVFFYTGCSNKYVERDYGSKKEYYADVNKRINDRNTQIKFMDGSSINSDNVRIKDDSVIWKERCTDKYRSTIPVSLIKSVKGNAVVSENRVIFNGSLRFKNDSVIEIKNALRTKDSISYNLSSYKNFSDPISNVSSFCIDDHLKGMFQYAFAGMFVGGVVGYKAGGDASIRERDPITGMAAGSILFFIGGLLPGLIAGSPQSFILNDDVSSETKFLGKFGILGGITSSMLYGGFSDKRSYTLRASEEYTFGLYYKWDINNVLKLRPEIIYSLKGGNYQYSKPHSGDYYSDYESSAIYIDFIETPILVQYGIPFKDLRFVDIFAGPSLNIPVKGETDEFYIGPMDEASEFSVRALKPDPYISFLYGAGIKWDRHFSTEILFDQGISSPGHAVLSDGTSIKLLQDDFLICTTFSL